MPRLTVFEEPLELIGSVTEDGHPIGVPTFPVRIVLAKLEAAGRLAPGKKVDLTDGSLKGVLEDRELALLNSFAATIYGREGCTINYIEGCMSCLLGCRMQRIGRDEWVRVCRYGNWFHTTCGVSCVYCATEIE